MIMVDENRIEQLRKITEADPNDELAHFSLGVALLQAKQPAEAAKNFQRVIALNSKLSKAYQHLGAAQEAAGQTQLAIETWTTGYRVAHRQGDVMPMKVMEQMLKKHGASVPAMAEQKDKPVAGATMTGFRCRRCGGGGPPLKERPFKGELGEQVLASVCADCWHEWIGMGTKVINELRLPLYDPEAQRLYDQHMKEFLMLE
jgi:Fe-S cluster biosynthesis and repair protein YggX